MKGIGVLLFFLMVIIACTKDKAAPSPYTDENFYLAASDTNGRFYYQGGVTLSPLGGSPHGSFKLFFNYKAASVLDANMEIPAGVVFPDSSFIVKEVYNGTNLVLYAFMFKNSGTWLWGESGPSGSIIYSIGNAGAACTGCHSITPNRDLVRTFDLH